MIKVSVIVPVYNVEEYIDKCLDSLVNQSLQDIEIILVNDGSTDNSQVIIDKYIVKYPSLIKCYVKENGGMSDARNFGLKYATGEYISFIDSDDYIDYNMLEVMYNKGRQTNCEVVYCDVNVLYPDKTLEIVPEIHKDINSLSLEDKKNMLINCYPVVWNKIYKRELFNKFYERDGLFKKDVWFEDARMLYKLIPDLNSVGYVNLPFYYYIQRPKSITYTYSNKLYDILSNLDHIIDYYHEKGIYDEFKDELEFIYVKYLYATFIKRLAKCKNKKTYMEGFNKVCRKVKNKYPQYKKNIYLKKLKPMNLYLKHFNKILANLIFIKEKNTLN